MQTSVLTAPLSIVVAVAGCLIVAGMLKGIIGVGMPIIALPLVTMFLDAPAAVMLLSMPLVLSNIPQALEGGEAAQCLLRLAPVLIGMLPGTLAGVAMLLVVKASVAKLLTGCIVVMVGSLTLFGRNFVLPSKSHTPMGLLSGFSGGVLGGLAAMPGPLVFTVPPRERAPRENVHQGSLHVPGAVRAASGRDADLQSAFRRAGPGDLGRRGGAGRGRNGHRPAAARQQSRR